MGTMRTCEIDDCDRPALARGMCSMHYARARRNGDPRKIVRLHTSNVEEALRHRSHVEGECWISDRAIIRSDRKDGRGNYRGIRVAGGPYRAVHIVSYEHFHGAVPEGYHVHHTCERKECWNPDHLVAMEAGAHRNLHHPKPTHCPHGHEYTPENTYEFTTNGYPARACRRCNTKTGRRERLERELGLR